MKKIELKMNYDFYLGNKKLTSGSLTSHFAGASKKLDLITLEHLYLLRAVLLGLLTKQTNNVPIGHLSIKATCNSVSGTIVDMCGALPTNAKEVERLLGDDTYVALKQIILDYLLAQ